MLGTECDGWLLRAGAVTGRPVAALRESQRLAELERTQAGRWVAARIVKEAPPPTPAA
jgi:hypothetical protein